MIAGITVASVGFEHPFLSLFKKALENKVSYQRYPAVFIRGFPIILKRGERLLQGP